MVAKEFIKEIIRCLAIERLQRQVLLDQKTVQKGREQASGVELQ